MRRLPSIASLRAFETAARLGSFKDAAEELNLSTSAISHQIRSLESELDCSLFIRHGAGVALTETGRDYLKAVTASLDQLERATLALTQSPQPEQLRISLLSSFSTLWLIPQMIEFRQRYPDIGIELVDDTNLVDFTVSAVDAAIRYDYSGTGHWQDITAIPLFEEWIVPVCSPDYLRDHPDIINLNFNPRDTLLVNKRHEDEWAQWFRAQRKPVTAYQQASMTVLDTSSMTLLAAAKGIGIALGRTPFVDQLLEDQELVRVQQGAQFRGIRHYLVFPQKSASSRAFQLFRDWLVEQADTSNSTAAGSFRFDS